MATFTVTTTTNIDALTGKTGGDIFNINGGNLTIDQHSRFGLNNGNTSATAATTMGSITLSATLGGTVTIDGRKVRLIQFTGGTGTIPTLNSTVTKGSASGLLMCVYSSLTAAPLVNGSAMPATGWIAIKQWNSVEYTAGTITCSGITATSTGASTVGFLEIMGDEASTVNANRLGTFNIYGEWFKLGTTTGVAAQTVQIPNHGTLRHVAGVYIEKTAGLKDYEFYPNAGTVTTVGTDSTRGKVVFISNTGLVTINSAGNYLPPVGLEIVVPNIFLCNSTIAARNAVVIPNATVGTRYDFTTTGGGVVNIDKANIEWYPSFAQPYSVQISNTGIIDGLIISECATACNWSKVGVGNKPTTALLMQPLTMSLMFAGGTFTDCVWTRVSHAASGAHTIGLTDIKGFNFIRNTIRANVIRANATTFSVSGTRLVDCYFEDTTIIQGSMTLVTCTNVNIKNTKYVDCVTGTTLTTYAMYVWSLSSNCLNITMDGLTFPITNTHPYTALLGVASAGCLNLKLRNIGTRAAPLTLGSVNACGLVFLLGSGCAASSVKVQRVYCSNTRTGIMTGDNSSNGVIVENVHGDYADAGDVAAVLNYERKGIGGTLALTAQTAVYGTHWSDYFTSTTAGRIAVVMNEPTALTVNQVTLQNGSAFTSAGGLYMPVIGMSATFEMTYFALGHISFTNTALIMAGGIATNYRYEYSINKNDGNGWSIMTSSSYTSTTIGTALSSITGIDASKGIKLRLKITTAVTNTTAITSVYVATGSSSIAQGYQYPLDTITLTLTGLQTGSDIVILQAGNEVQLEDIQGNSGTTYNYVYESAQSIDIGVFKEGYVPFYIRNYSLGSTNASLPIAQVADRNYI